MKQKKKNQVRLRLKLPPEQTWTTRGKVVHVRLTDEENDEIRAAAKASGMLPSQLVRYCVRRVLDLSAKAKV